MGSTGFRVLGPLEVDGVAALGGPRQRALLARLLLSADEPVPVQELVDAVWDEHPPAGAARSLEVYASRLRGLISHTGAAIVRRGEGYELALGAVPLDARVFGRLADAGRSALAAGDAAEARSRLADALALWRGPAVADVPGRLGEPLDELRRAAAEDLAEAELALGHDAELVTELQQRAREQPLRERTRAQLMLALYRSGRQAEALDVYREGRAALDELGLEPGVALRELELAILRQDAALAVEPVELRERRHLPAPVTGFVGRRDEIEELTALLRGETRLLTLTGAGGIGKTRLALQAAHELAAAFEDGVWFVGLAPLADHALVEGTIAAALEAREAPLDRHLAERSLLLVLDNFEHVAEAAPLVSRLLAAAPGLKVLATSRSRLDLYGERDYPVPPLQAEEATTLFLERARAAHHGFTAGAGIDELCRRFDRLPLALELVAARARELTLPALLDAVGLDLASGGPRDLPERQRTLRAAIAWSEERLAAREREQFAALGVFAGGFEREAVEDVWGGSADSLPALIDAALVSRDDSGRLRMLATVREYALDRLAGSAAANAVRRRHLDHYARLAAELAPRLLGAGDADAHARLEQERDNLRAAFAYAQDQGLDEVMLGLVRDLSRFWYVHGTLAEGASWAEAALAAGSAEPLLRAQALKGAALLDWKRGELELGRARAQEALGLIEALGDESELLGALSVLGAIAYGLGEMAEAAAHFSESATRARQLGRASYLAIALNNLAAIQYEQRDWQGARRAYDESLAVGRELGSKELEAFALLGLGAVSLNVDELEQAGRELLAALVLFSELGSQDRVGSCCSYLAALAHATGDDEQAARLLGAAAGLRAGAGTTTDRAEAEETEQTRSAVEASLGSGAFAAAVRAGSQEKDRVVAEVLAGPVSTLSE